MPKITTARDARLEKIIADGKAEVRDARRQAKAEAKNYTRLAAYARRTAAEVRAMIPDSPVPDRMESCAADYDRDAAKYEALAHDATRRAAVDGPSFGRPEVDDVLLAADGAYSEDRYAPDEWRKCAAVLLSRGFTVVGAAECMKSKHMRWAADMDGGEYGNVTAAGLIRYLADRKAEDVLAECERWAREALLESGPAAPAAVTA
jgi:hypothetical protein